MAARPLARAARAAPSRSFLCQSAALPRFYSAPSKPTKPLPSPEQATPLPPPEPETTHFGFRTVKASEKAEKVHDVFSSVAASYDVMNDVMSAGIHRLWKDHFVRSLDPGRRPGGSPQRILDVAGGTGDIAFRMLDNAANLHHDLETSVICADINADMLREGEKRAHAQGYLPSDRISFKVQDAETLDAIPDNSMDLYTISFGIRNVTRIDKALESAYRVLKPGGVFACLEFSKVSPAPLDALYQMYSFSIIPMMGQLVAGDRDSYQYLVESIKKFPSQDDFAQMVRNAGFMTAGRGYEELTFGVASIWKGIKPLKK